jgi:RimJ/RimL family protein N-acetyltransferase
LPDLQSVLVGAQVEIRPLRADDWDAFYAIAADPLIWALHPHGTRWQEPVCRQFFADGLSSGGGLMIIDRATGQPIGSSRYALSKDALSVEIGWTFLARAYWGGAWNRAVKRLMLAHALASVDRVTFRVGAANLRSRRAMEKIGGVLSAQIDTIMVQGVPVDHVTYMITRDNFATGPLSQAA